MNALLSGWDGLDDAGRAQWTAVAGCVLLFCIHFIVYSPWLIEDAAITFSFARHAASGEGWVTYPGGEWVEGFSNPTWTALLTTTAFLGISPWFAAKSFGLLFGVLTLPMAFLWAREVTRDDGLLPCLAPLWLAVSPQFVTWVSSGLENALWIWCLALGSLLFLRELERGGVPWSAVPMALLAITRPEGPLYVAVMAFTGVGLAPRQPKVWLRIAGWAAFCAAIWAGYIAYRFAVFGWPLPNTYYAKLHVGAETFQPWNWGGSDNRSNNGWGYLRSWSMWSTWGFLLPLFPVAATGWRGWRGQLGMGVGAVLALLLIPGCAWLVNLPGYPLATEPAPLVYARFALIWFALLVLPWLGYGRPGYRARILAWTLTAGMVVYVVYVGADWMTGHRWISHAVVPLAVLLADMVVNLFRAREWAEPARAKRMIFVAVAGLPLVAGVVQTAALQSPTETSPFDVARRVAYVNGVQDRLHIDHTTVFDVDMGATQWWSEDKIVDVAGLVDTSMAQHAWEPAFVREYVLRERRPEFMHSHGHWATRSGMSAQPTFVRDYLRIDDFVAGSASMHVGNYVRRDLVIRPRWTGTLRTATFGTKLRLEGIDFPAPIVPAGGTLFVELGWRALEDGIPPFRALLVLAREGRVVAVDLPPAYDWLMPPEWRRSDVVHGSHSVRLPADLEPGSWDVALVVQGRGGVWFSDQAVAEPVFARGEVRWEGMVEVATPERVAAVLGLELGRFAELASSGKCEQAEQSLKTARRTLAKDDPNQPWSRPEIHTALARCWAHVASESPLQAAESAISRARDWDHRDKDVVGIGRTLADTWEAEGHAAWEEGNAGRAYSAWRRALAADPSRSHLRPLAEEARDLRLGLTKREEAP